MPDRIPPTHAKSVRLSPYYVRLLEDLLHRTRLRNKSQIVQAAITLVYQALLRSSSGRVVLRSEEHRRQRGLDLTGSVVESHIDHTDSHSTSLRLNLPHDLQEQLQAIINGGFAPDESKAIRRALFMLNHVAQHLNAGWELGWIDDLGAFNAIPTALSTPAMTVAICSEDRDAYQSLLTMMIHDIENRLPEILAKAEYSNEDPRDVASRFLSAGSFAIAQLNMFEQCHGNVDLCIKKLTELAIGVNVASNPSLVIAVRNLDDIEAYFIKPVLAHLTNRIPVYFLHDSEDSLRSLDTSLRHYTSEIDDADMNCFAVVVEAEYFNTMPETIVSHFESSILRCGIKWFASGGKERRFEPLSSDNLDQFFDQVEPRIRNGVAKPPDDVRTFLQLRAISS
jgi:Arc/MetJ-type ribon-helix-helix transcriptional regulator